MNPDLEHLQPYPFERLRQLLSEVTPKTGKQTINLSVGEPKHTPPGIVTEALITHLHRLANYPLTRGRRELREAIGEWLINRFHLPQASLDPDRHILPVNGTREALFAFAQTVIDRSKAPVAIMPNPFYQIYEGAVLLAGAEPWYLNTTEADGYLPNFSSVPDTVWRRCQLVYVCTPGNPTGAVLPEQALQGLIELADRFDFVIASDECYSEIYPDRAGPPPGLLGAAAAMGRKDFRRCMVFHSLSKRSNLPGMRSGFVAGDAEIMDRFFQYRTYHGCAMPPATQAASTVAWQDESHVVENRRYYTDKFSAVLDVIGNSLAAGQPEGAFYLWPKLRGSDTEFARELYREQNLIVLPGSFLSRDTEAGNPGYGYVRMALVAPLDECVDAAGRIREFSGSFT